MNRAQSHSQAWALQAGMEQQPMLWRTAAVDKGVAERLAAEMLIPVRVARWLCARAGDENEAREWLSAPDNAAGLPWQWFHGMEAAVRLLLEYIAAGQRVCVVGDYDVDGVTASAILGTCLDAVDADWFCVIPHRVEDGYGLSTRLVERAREAGAKVIVTVDNGIRANEAVTYATELGLSVIVTDHHEPGQDLPTAAQAIVHWVASDEPTAVARLSGAGVARKLADAMFDALRSLRATEAAERLAGLCPWLDGLATLGALADVMPMRGENRRLVRAGIEALRRTTMPGWIALCQSAGIDAANVTEQSLLWNITPRLNAAGRMGSATVAFELLMAPDPTCAQRAAEQIEAWNRARREATDKAATEAAADCVERFGETVPGGIVVSGTWPLGVVGIVAARLCDRYKRPIIVLADDGSGLLRGSGRAPAGFPLLETVSHCATYLAHFGGHDSAIGCGLEKDQLNSFRTAFDHHAEAWWQSRAADSDVANSAGVFADDYLPLAEVTLDTWSWVNRVGPFGPDNEPLLFYLGPLEVVRVRTMGGRGQHLRVEVREGANKLELVWFSADDVAKTWQPGRRIGALVHLEENVWQGVRRVQARVVSAHSLSGAVIDRGLFTDVYRLLRARRRLHFGETSQTQALEADKLNVILDTFVELGFARREASAYHMVDEATPCDLRESPSYQQHLAWAWSNP
ncbi:single-stranded-DNA-specific exonuclease C-terminal domain-containing protein [Alicyclobacillus sp. ALC3]|uniref:single-stranded-DNA-specific exonuclease C-terminal domain-containing protein n=1 Tax=Alicyclobacillus sp. ALC3 TaxID=2796143 RepID=UPI0023786AC0|nr:single-stranded-DNA-specific exonuclease C-terminal domain-containing protein [Alicyclobacillus sp. ALC3]WDL96191.1 single-stranded-DNA-specific exonuclease C-terminal domain-containing protein [Alicyclobacillus sp. ALC3]